jgi:hypothetical protein
MQIATNVRTRLQARTRLFRAPILRAFGALGLLAFFSATAQADSLTGPVVSDTLILTTMNGQTTLTTGLDAPIDYSGTLMNNQVTLTLAAIGNANDGEFEAIDNWDLSGASSYWSSVTTTASFIGQMIVTSPTQAAGTPGYLFVTYDVSGTTSGPAVETLSVGYQDSGPSGTGTWEASANSPIPGSSTYMIPFYYDYAFDFGPTLSVTVSLNPDLDGTTDSDNTVVITGLVTAVQPGSISNSTFMSTLGLQYTPPSGAEDLAGSPAPEPGSLLLLAPGLCAILAAYRLRAAHD